MLEVKLCQVTRIKYNHCNKNTTTSIIIIINLLLACRYLEIQIQYFDDVIFFSYTMPKFLIIFLYSVLLSLFKNPESLFEEVFHF